MRVLAFDQATKCGYCVLDDGKLIDYGVKDFSSGYVSKKNKAIVNEALKERFVFDECIDIFSWAERICKIKEFVFEKYDFYKPDIIVFETVQDNNNHDVHTKLAGLLNVLVTECCEKDIKFLVYPIINWKHDVGIKLSKLNEIGKNVKTVREDHKLNAILIVQEKYGIDVGDDCADAICIACATHGIKGQIK